MSLRGAVFFQLMLIWVLALAEARVTKGQNQNNLISDEKTKNIKPPFYSDFTYSVFKALGKLPQENTVEISQVVHFAADMKMVLKNGPNEAPTTQKSNTPVTTEQAQISETEDKCQDLKQQMRVDGSQFFNASGKTFHFNLDKKVSWFIAKIFCERRGMQLAIQKTVNELDEMQKALEKFGMIDEEINEYRWFWMGASDMNRSPGLFYWTDGTEVDKATWSHEYPQNFKIDKKSCADFNSKRGRLYDFGCINGASNILCQVPASCV